MADQKLENILNLALDATEEERDKSLELNVGYNPIDREWDLIVKYSGSLVAFASLIFPSVPNAACSFAISCSVSLIDTLS